MDAQTVTTFLSVHTSDYPRSSYFVVKERLATMNEQQFAYLMSKGIKSPIIAFILSFFLGSLGVDRFYIGDILLGLLKLLTLGGLGIWWFIDLFVIIPSTRKKNLNNLLTA